MKAAKTKAVTYQCLGITLRVGWRKYSRLTYFGGKREGLEIVVYKAIAPYGKGEREGDYVAELMFKRALSTHATARSIPTALKQLEQLAQRFASVRWTLARKATSAAR